MLKLIPEICPFQGLCEFHDVPKKLNPLHAKLFRRNKKTYITFYVIPHIDITQVVKILPQVRQGPTYST